MKRAWIIFAVIAASAFILVIIFWGNGEPRYQDRALSQWILDTKDAEINAGDGYRSDPKWRAATNAVYQMGTNALPTLLKWAFARDLKPKAAILSWINAHPALRLHLKDASFYQKFAARGFQLLDLKVEAAWPALDQYTYSRDPEERSLALTWLYFTSGWNHVTSPPPKNINNPFLLPASLRLFKDPDTNVQYIAAVFLNLDYPEDAETAGVYKQFPALKSIVRADSPTNQPVAR